MGSTTITVAPRSNQPSTIRGCQLPRWVIMNTGDGFRWEQLAGGLTGQVSWLAVRVGSHLVLTYIHKIKLVNNYDDSTRNTCQILVLLPSMRSAFQICKTDSISVCVTPKFSRKWPMITLLDVHFELTLHHVRWTWWIVISCKTGQQENTSMPASITHSHLHIATL